MSVEPPASASSRRRARRFARLRSVVVAWATLGAVGACLGCEEPKAEPEKSETPDRAAQALEPKAAAQAVAPETPEAAKKAPITCPPAPALLISDPALEAEIRKRTGKAEGKLTRKDLQKIKTISLTKKKVEMLDPCVFPLLTNLVYLYVGRGSVDDLAPIRDLTKIEDLSITSNPVADLSALAGMTKMDRLVLSRTQVRDLSPLAGMTKLTELTLSDTPVSDITPLAGLKKLEKLFIERTRLSDVSALKGLTRLKSLHVTGSPVDNPYVRKGVKVVD